MREEAGFHTLQLITLLIAHVWSMDHAGMHARVLMLLTQTDHALAQVTPHCRLNQLTQPIHRLRCESSESSRCSSSRGSTRAARRC